MFKMAVQQGQASEGPSRALWGTLKGLSEARTPLADIFNILVIMARHYTDSTHSGILGPLGHQLTAFSSQLSGLKSFWLNAEC
jgi:hypothetical protein